MTDFFGGLYGFFHASCRVLITHTRVGRSKNGWRRKVAARSHYSSVVTSSTVARVCLIWALWRGGSQKGLETRLNYLLKSGSGDKVRNTPFPALERAYFPFLCGLFYRVAKKPGAYGSCLPARGLLETPGLICSVCSK